MKRLVFEAEHEQLRGEREQRLFHALERRPLGCVDYELELPHVLIRQKRAPDQAAQHEAGGERQDADGHDHAPMIE